MSTAYQIYKSLIYKSIKAKNKLKKFRSPPIHHKYLFILSPPYSGSTLLHEILSTSSLISPNHTFDTREGQQLPELKNQMFIKGRFEADFSVDWKRAHAVWHKYWDPTAPILMDKSPANIVRAGEIEKHFQPIYFLVLVRNPYAQCESLIRKNNWTAMRSATFAVECLEHQRRNLEQLQHTSLLTYEVMTEDEEKIKSALHLLLPEVNDLRVNQKFNAHNFQNEALKPTNLNAKKMQALSSSQNKELNQVFSQHEDLLNYFGYQLQ